MKLDISEFRGPVDCREEIKLAPDYLYFGDVDVEIVDRKDFKFLLCRLIRLDTGQSEDAVPLQGGAAMNVSDAGSSVTEHRAIV